MSNGVKILLAIIVGILLLACGVIFIGYNYINGIYTEGVTKEIALSTEYESAQNYLAGFVSGFYEQTGLMEFQSEQVSNVLVSAILAQPGDENFGGDALFASITQAFPDAAAAGLSENFDTILRYIQAQREGFRAQQDKLLDRIRDYETWRKADLFHSFVAQTMGFPTDNLQARVGGQVIAQGEEALAILRRIILNSDTVDAYNTGILEPLNPNRSSGE